jgi:uroporphyrinogen-III decarboxylase
MFDRARYFQDMTDGKIGINIPDLQGPFSVASQLWGVQEFLLALYEYPDEVRELLDKTTKALIHYVRMFKDEFGDNLRPIHCMPDAWMPNSAGICISEDLIAVVSPQVFTEFIAPGLTALAESFGGCYVHSCGSIEHNVEAMLKVPGLRGVNFSTSESDVCTVAKRSGGALTLMPHTAPVASTHLRLLNPEEHAKLCFSAFRTNQTPGYVFVDCMPGMYAGDDKMVSFSRRLREWSALG